MPYVLCQCLFGFFFWAILTLSSQGRELTPELLFKDSWQSLQHSRFNLITDATDSKALEIYHDLAEFDFYINRILNPTLVAGLKPVTLFLVTRPSGKTLLTLVNNCIGFTQKGLRGDYIVAGLDRYPSQLNRITAGHPIRNTGNDTLRHEYVHFLLRNSQEYGGGLPLWLEEGLAEYWSTLVVSKKKVKYGYLKNEHLRSLPKNRAVPLEKILNTRIVPQSLRQGQNLYGYSTLLTHYLMTQDSSKRSLKTFSLAIRTGLSLESAFTQWIKMDYKTLGHGYVAIENATINTIALKQRRYFR